MSKDKQPRKEIVEVTLSDSDEETQDTSVSNIETVVSTGTEELVCEVDPAAVQNGDTDEVDTDEEVVVTYVGPPKKDGNPSPDPRRSSTSSVSSSGLPMEGQPGPSGVSRSRSRRVSPYRVKKCTVDLNRLRLEDKMERQLVQLGSAIRSATTSARTALQVCQVGSNGDEPPATLRSESIYSHYSRRVVTWVSVRIAAYELRIFELEEKLASSYDPEERKEAIKQLLKLKRDALKILREVSMTPRASRGFWPITYRAQNTMMRNLVHAEREVYRRYGWEIPSDSSIPILHTPF